MQGLYKICGATSTIKRKKIAIGRCIIYVAAFMCLAGCSSNPETREAVITETREEAKTESPNVNQGIRIISAEVSSGEIKTGCWEGLSATDSANLDRLLQDITKKTRED